MLLSAILRRDELALVLESILPLRVVLDPERDRSVTFDHAELDLVRGRGVRLRGKARVVWDVAGVAIPITIQSWQVLLEPRIGAVLAGKPWVLACEPILEELDLKMCPTVIDGKIAEAVEGALAKARDRLAWDFGRALSRHLPLPKRVQPERAIDLMVVGGACAVSEIELALRVELTARPAATATAARNNDVPPSRRTAPRAIIPAGRAASR